MTASYERAVVEHIIDLYEDGPSLVALIEVIPEPTCLLVENVAVSPEHQRKGIGDLLLSHAGDLARSLGLTELRLYTNAAFVTNIAFYARRGFHESGREPLSGGGELVHMSKLIGTRT
jgi:GNAT superfamily N-acetyltransferase